MAKMGVHEHHEAVNSKADLELKVALFPKVYFYSMHKYMNRNPYIVVSIQLSRTKTKKDNQKLWWRQRRIYKHRVYP